MRAFLVLLLLVVPGTTAVAAVIDDFDDVRDWIAAPSDGVELRISSDRGAMRLDFDFRGGAGYAIARRPVKLRLPADYEFTFRMRGEAPPNTLEFKLLDPTGENVWWLNQRNLAFPREWKKQRILKRHIEFAWGPSGGAPLTEISALEIVITASTGGKGTVWIDDLAFEERAPRPPHPPAPHGAWRGDDALTIDFGAPHEFGGLTLDWDAHATDYDVEVSNDAKTWETIAEVRGSTGGRDPLFLPDSDARYVRLRMLRGTKPFALRGITFEPLAFSSSRNAFFLRLAAAERRGLYPRALQNEQSYWTIVGDVNQEREALLSEDGALEPDRASFSIEPFLFTDRLITWNDVRTTQSLANGYLPVPSVAWDAGLTVTAWAEGDTIFARYRVANPSNAPRKVTLFLAIRPFQVNPPWQFLNVPGGVSPIHELSYANGVVHAQGLRIATTPSATAFGATTFAAGDITESLARNALPAQTSVHDAFGAASGALRYELTIPANGFRDVIVSSGAAAASAAEKPAPEAGAAPQEAIDEWARRLDRFTLQLSGDEGAAIARAIKSNVAWILINQDGPAIQPGSRSYDRSWIRDGSLTSDALLRLGYADAVKPFVEWFAPFQFPSGKVPCCVDARGADPVPEHDSHGQLIFLIAEYYRHTGDRALVERLWPHVERAVAYIESLTAERKTAKYQGTAYYGLVPESISHEGYSAKPMHSYWDDFFVLRGLQDAAYLATILGKETNAARLAETFRTDLHASIDAARAMHNIDYIPGSVELGDFDATSTTVALSPGSERTRLDPAALHATFERYYRESMHRIATNQWEGYTPYEWRTVGSFVRLGWRARAHEMVRFFLGHLRPAGWNQWAEVVFREPRNPKFIGDMPHTWVGSDFIRSILDMFAYEEDGKIIVNAGVPVEWTRGEGAVLRGLRTSHGILNITIKDGQVVELSGEAASAAVVPSPR